MNSIEIFKNESFGEVRVTGTSDEPLFCLADVCHAIGIANPRNVKNRIDEDDVHLIDTLTDGGIQKVTYVTESGLYDVIIRSDSERAKPFRKWVTSVVLPSIRKTGHYIANEVQKSVSVRDKITVATWLIKTLNMNESSKLLLAKTIADPLGLLTPDYTKSSGQLLPASILLHQNQVPMSARDFNKIMIKEGYMTELTRPSSKGMKRFKSLSAKADNFGENQVSPNNPKETQPLYYADKFTDLLKLLRIA